MKLRMKTYLGLIVLLVGIMLSSCGQKQGVIANVNGEDITETEFKEELEIYIKIEEQRSGSIFSENGANEDNELFQKLRANILQKIILEKVIEQDAKKINLIISDEEVKNAKDQFIKSIDGEENYQNFLNNNSISESFFEDHLKKAIQVEKHKENFVENIKISEDEYIKAYNRDKEELKTVAASMILSESFEKATLILERLNKGEKFEDLALMESIHKASALDEGKLGYFRKGTYIADIENIAFNLDKGELSNIVKTELGYVILRVDDMKDSLDELKNDIDSEIRIAKYLDYIEELRKAASIKIFDKSLKSS